MRLHDFLDSGNGYKVRLLLAHLEIDYEFVELDILKGETRTPDFLAKNPNGRIPLIQLDDGTFLSESNAILYHLYRKAPLTGLKTQFTRPGSCNGCSSSSTTTNPQSQSLGSGRTSLR